MKFKVTIDISGKPEKVFSWIDNPEKAKRWQEGVKGGEIIKETPERIGTKFIEEIEEEGKSLVMHGEITDYTPNTSISFHLESKIHKVDVAYSVIGENDKSKVTIESKIRWSFPMNIISLFIGHKIKAKILNQTSAEFAELKRLCENSQLDLE